MTLSPDDTPEMVNSIVATILRDVCELPDRSSPDDDPNMVLVTLDELDLIVRDAITPRLASTKALREALSALKPFAAYADYVDQHHAGWAHDGFRVAGFEDVWRYSDFANARSVLAALASGDNQ